jgi:glycerol-3-phosphate O-acyltransferase
MTQTVAVPYWLLVLIIAFAAVSFASNFLFPSVRWFFRARMERAVARLNTRLDRPIDLFKLAERQDRIARLIYDSKVMDAVAEHAAETGLPVPVAFEEARRYAREIVPGFSTTLYFGVAIRLARGLSRTLYRVRFGRPDGALRQIDRGDTVVFVMNHRSNMDYVLVTWLVANRASISYAVGEWARIWPLSVMIRTMGAYFIRRSSRNALYRKVLARYVQMTTAEGITQAIFPEGGLSLDGRVGEAKLGLLSYIVAGYTPGGRDVVFVPVGIAYDRVLEDRILTKAAEQGNRRFPTNPFAIVFGALSITLRVLLRRFKGFGTAAASFGDPVSLSDFMLHHHSTTTEALGRHLMAAIVQVVPVVPVPVVAAALLGRPASRAALTQAVQALLVQLEAAGAVLKLPPEGIEATVAEGLTPLMARGLIGADLQPTEGSQRVLDFYSASVLQRLQPAAGRDPDAAPRMALGGQSPG